MPEAVIAGFPVCRPFWVNEVSQVSPILPLDVPVANVGGKRRKRMDGVVLETFARPTNGKPVSEPLDLRS